MKAHVTQIHYCVPLTQSQWAELNRLDDEGNDRWEEIASKMKKAGADNLEYNGHFGSNIFFSVETAVQLPRVLKCIEKLVKPS